MTGENDNSSASKLTKIQFKDDAESIYINYIMYYKRDIVQSYSDNIRIDY